MYAHQQALGKKIFLIPPTYQNNKWEEEFQKHNVLIQRISKNSCRYLKNNYFVRGRCSTSTHRLIENTSPIATPRNKKPEQPNEKILPKLAALNCYFAQRKNPLLLA